MRELLSFESYGPMKSFKAFRGELDMNVFATVFEIAPVLGHKAI